MVTHAEGDYGHVEETSLSDDDSATDDASLSESNKSDEDSPFHNQYEAKDVLGRGLASTVRKCVEKLTGKMFAVKIVDVSTEQQSLKDAMKLREETKSEVALLKELSGHPAIIHMHDYYETSSFLFAVIEMAPKGELFDQLTKAVTFSEKRTKKLMRQLLDGVNYMQRRNIVHRDLKLENILCIDDERIVISDFGFAVKLAPGQKLKDLCGTPGYLAPEVLRCQMYEDCDGYSLEVDLWACGVIMYTLIAGYAPFYHRRQMIMLRMIQEAKYEFRPEQWDAISPEAKELIKNLLVIDVKSRLTAEACLKHPWMAFTEAVELPKVAPKARFRRAVRMVRFLCRLQKMKDLNREVDKMALRKRPYRDRQIRHESEAAVFAVYGHWVNRGFYYSRDMLFANKPRPKRKREN
uniref:phosphorylase kinase n=1 Tax=Plectus sambesii TaxID=2011161 RepID=A0A914VIA2_9BILA